METIYDRRSWLIRTDLSQVMDFEASLFGYDNERGQEVIAEEAVEFAKARHHDWLMGSLYPEVKEMVNRQVENVDCGGKNNTAAIEAEAERRAYFSKKYSLEWAIAAAEQRLKDTQTYLDLAMCQAQIEVESDKRTQYVAWREQFVQLMETLPDTDLMFILEEDDDWSLKFRARWILIERWTAAYRRIQSKLKKYESWALKHFTKLELQEAYKAYGRAVAYDSADDYFSLAQGLRTLFNLKATQKTLRASLVAEKENVDSGKVRVLKAKEKAFWARQENPDVIVAVEPGQKFWFETADGYLPGSCTEVKYVHANGDVSYIE